MSVEKMGIYKQSKIIEDTGKSYRCRRDCKALAATAYALTGIGGEGSKVRSASPSNVLLTYRSPERHDENCEMSSNGSVNWSKVLGDSVLSGVIYDGVIHPFLAGAFTVFIYETLKIQNAE